MKDIGGVSQASYQEQPTAIDETTKIQNCKFTDHSATQDSSKVKFYAGITGVLQQSQARTNYYRRYIFGKGGSNS